MRVSRFLHIRKKLNRRFQKKRQIGSSSEISQDTLSTLKFEFWPEILWVGSESFNIYFQTTGVLMINEK